MSDRKKGLIFAFSSAILYGLIPILGKKFVLEFSPLFVALIVTLISDIYFAGIVLWRRELFSNLFRKQIRWVVLVGFLAALGSVLSFVGLSVGKANEAGFFFQFETFFAAILAFLFLQEKLTRHQIIGLGIMFLGAYIFSFHGTFNLGNLFFLATALLWGLNDTIIRRKNRDFSSFFLAFGRSFFSALFLLPLAYRYIPQNVEKITITNIYFFLIYGGVVAGILLSKYFALRYLKTAEATAFQVASPVVTLVVAFFVLREQLVSIQLIGGSLVLAGLYLTTRPKKLL